MMNAPGVAVAGHGGAYPAIILTPTEHGIRADGILTEGTADVLRHGLAWLGGDFRDGPSEEITSGETIILKSAAPISLEYDGELRSEEHTSELQSLMRISYAVFCLKKKTVQKN